MLLGLHVKNLALIEEEEVEFSDGLNILTGETGAGKSIIIGSVNLALGAKADKSLIRTGCDYALIELTFSLDNERQREVLRSMDLPEGEDGVLLIKRKVMPSRSACSVCGESVTLKQLRELGEVLIDIYGQRENQKLLKKGAQLQTIDEYAGDEASSCHAQAADTYRKWKKLTSEWERDDLDGAARKREIDLLSFEIQEIDAAALKQGEDEELEEEFQRMKSFQKISEAASSASSFTEDGQENASSLIERGCRELLQVAGIDKDLDELSSQLSEIESLLSDFNRSLHDYLLDLTFDPARFEEVQERLNTINHLKDKYGNSIEEIQKQRDRRQQRVDELVNYEEHRTRLQEEIAKEYRNLMKICANLSGIRTKAAEEFAAKMKEALLELNFAQVEFKVEITADEQNVGENGYDRAVFMISMNPGESLRPLEQIASGGELSRIMLALKTVFAGRDDIHSFIFDEIDTGISGQTAWKVAEKLGRLAKDHQILCITHLPQIAAMEDVHFLIRKESSENRTVTHITRLNEDESDRELARLLGGARITDAVLENAREMKQEAAASRMATA